MGRETGLTGRLVLAIVVGVNALATAYLIADRHSEVTAAIVGQRFLLVDSLGRELAELGPSPKTTDGPAQLIIYADPDLGFLSRQSVVSGNFVGVFEGGNHVSMGLNEDRARLSVMHDRTGESWFGATRGEMGAQLLVVTAPGRAWVWPPDEAFLGR